MDNISNLLKKLVLPSHGVIGLIFVTALVVRLLGMPLRWINPDEGAHLMDARLLLQGMIPVVDYASRQPLYTLLLAICLKLFGMTLWAGRLLPILACVGIGWMIFLIGRRLFDASTGIVAAAIYLFLPYTLIWSTVVKTEMPAVFFCCVAAYLLIVGLQSQSRVMVFFFLAGISSALAFYVRQTTLYLPAAVFLFLLFYPTEDRSVRWRRLGVYFAGFISVCLLVGLYYGYHLGLRSLLFSQLNPVHLIVSRLGHFFGALPAELRVVDSEGYRILEQDPAYAMQSWRDAVFFAAFILFAAGLALVQQLQSGDQQKANHIILLWLLWPLLAFLAYVYQSIQSVFYSQYFLEVVPYLTILAAAQILYLCKRLSWSVWRTLLMAALVFYVIFLLMRYFWHWQWPVAAHLSFAVGLTVVYMLAEKYLWKRIQSPLPELLTAAIGIVALAWLGHFLRLEPLVYAAIAVMAMALVSYRRLQDTVVAALLLVTFGWFLTASYSGARIGPKYEAVWSPSTLHQVTKILTSQSEPSDTVLSGAMIWTFASGLQPYGGVTHPTVFIKKFDEDFEKKFQQQRPSFIILDGHSEKKFARYWSFIREEMEMNYSLVAEVKGAHYPVRIYRCKQLPFPLVPHLAGYFLDERGAL